MNVDDLIKAHRDQQLGGVVIGDPAICFCGQKYTPFPGDDTGTGCEACRSSSLLIDGMRRAGDRKIVDRLLSSPRPKLGQMYRSLWIQIRRQGRPARERNRCWCGGRVTTEKLLRVCGECAVAHRKNLIWDAVNHREELDTAKTLAAKYGLEEFLTTLLTPSSDRLSPWKERSIQISSGAAADMTGGSPAIQPTANFNRRA